MPMIHLTVPAGLSGPARDELLRSLPTTLLKWEGAPDSAFFRAQAWCRVEDVAAGGFAAKPDSSPTSPSRYSPRPVSPTATPGGCGC